MPFVRTMGRVAPSMVTQRAEDPSRVFLRLLARNFIAGAVGGLVLAVGLVVLDVGMLSSLARAFPGWIWPVEIVAMMMTFGFLGMSATPFLLPKENSSNKKY